MECKTIRAFILMTFISFNCVVQGQNFNPDQNYLYNSYTSINSDPDLFNDISLNAHDLITTNIQFSKDDDLQKVVIVPFRLSTLEKINGGNNFLYNTKINLAQKSGISTLGLGFTWDNSLPGTVRGERIFKNFNQKVAKIKEKLSADFLIKLKQEITKAEKQELDYAISAKMINDLKKILKRLEDRVKENTSAGFSLSNRVQSDFLSKDGWSYVDYVYYKALFDKFNMDTKTKLDVELTNEYYNALLKNSVKITFGGNWSYFKILGSDTIDLDNDNLNDNENSLKQKNLSLGFTHLVNEIWGYNTTAYFLNKRASAEEQNDLQPYFGLSASVGFRAWIFNENYKTSKEYIETLFVPSMHAGLAFEYLDCNAKDSEDCEDGIQKTYGITPYVEFKINPKNQFRLGIPITKTTQFDSKKETIGPFIQWRLQLTGNN